MITLPRPTREVVPRPTREVVPRHLPFARWGDVFGDQTVAAAMIDRIVHHADVHTLKGGSYRLKHLAGDTLPSVRLSDQTN
jgi:hypothetical protein